MSSQSGKSLAVEIADVGQLIYSGHCEWIVAPAALGEVCILPRHTPFLSKLRPGEIRLSDQNDEIQRYFVSGGYLEVQPSAVTVLADRMLRSDQIDREAALAAKREAEEILASSHLFTERDRAKVELLMALAQLRVTEPIQFARLKPNPTSGR